MPRSKIRKTLLFVLFLTFPLSSLYGQESKYRRWESSKDGNTFVARFEGLSGKTAIFVDKRRKILRVPLSQLDRKSLELLILESARDANLDALKKSAETTSDQNWKSKLTGQFTKSVDDLEEYYSKTFAGTEKWTDAKRESLSTKYHEKIRSQTFIFRLPCKVVGLKQDGESYQYRVSLCHEEGDDLKLFMTKCPNPIKFLDRVTATIYDVKLDIGEEVILTCLGSVSLTPGKDARDFSRELYQQSRPLSDKHLLDRSKRGPLTRYKRRSFGFKLSGAGVLDDGINKNGRHYYFEVVNYDILSPGTRVGK